MALIPKNTYPGQTIADDAGYPQGAPRNATSLNDGTGFPIERRWIADIFGLLQSLLDDAGITPSGNPDRVGESQYLQALHALFFDEQEVSNEIDSRLGSTKSITWFPYHVGTAVRTASLDVSGEASTLRDVKWNGDGTKLYILGLNVVYEYDVATPYDLSTVTYDSVSLSVSDEDPASTAFVWSANGAKFYMLGASNGRVFQYTASTPYDLSTVTYDSVSLVVSSQEATPLGLAWSVDGTKMFVCGNTSGHVHQYTASTPYDLSTVTYDSVSLDVSGQDSAPNRISWSPDGVNLFVSGQTTGEVYQYTTATPYDLDDAEFLHVSLGIQGDPTGMAWDGEGLRLLVAIGGGTALRVDEYFAGRPILGPALGPVAPVPDS